MANKIKWARESVATLASTELNSLANNAMALGAEIDNSTDLHRWGDFELLFGTGANATVDAVIRVWLLEAADGTNYEDGGASVEPRKAPDLVFTVRAATSQRITIKGVPLPPSKFKALVRNECGQSFSSSGNTLRMLPYNEEVQ
jgi:hypothetical protein